MVYGLEAHAYEMGKFLVSTALFLYACTAIAKEQKCIYLLYGFFTMAFLTPKLGQLGVPTVVGRA